MSQDHCLYCFDILFASFNDSHVTPEYPDLQGELYTYSEN